MQKNMVKSICTLCIMVIIALHVAAQPATYPFEVKKYGSAAKAIIFIPGFASSGTVWNETVAHFDDAYTCYVLTMAGFAGVPAQANATFKNWEKGIAAYISNNHIQQPVIIGHSMGGGLAMALAADYPQLIGSIVVVDALPCLNALMNPSFKAKDTADCSGTTAMLTKMSDTMFRQMQVMGVKRLMADSVMRDTVVSWSLATDRKTFAQMYCDFSNTDLRQKIAGITCKNLVMLEAFFSNYTTQVAEQFALWKNANLQYATKGLHFIMYDDKDWYFKQLDGFLNP